jgi:hypothetical protein
MEDTATTSGRHVVSQRHRYLVHLTVVPRRLPTYVLGMSRDGIGWGRWVGAFYARAAKGPRLPRSSTLGFFLPAAQLVLCIILYPPLPPPSPLHRTPRCCRGPPSEPPRYARSGPAAIDAGRGRMLTRAADAPAGREACTMRRPVHGCSLHGHGRPGHLQAHQVRRQVHGYADPR